MLLGITRKTIYAILACLLILLVMIPPALAALPHENPDEAPQIFSGLSLFNYYANSLDFVLKKEPMEVEARLQKMPFANLPPSLRGSTDKFTASGINISYLIVDIDRNIEGMRLLVSEFRLSESTELSAQIASDLSNANDLLEKLRTATEASGIGFYVRGAPPTSGIRVAYDAVLERIDRIKELLGLYKSLLTDLQGKNLRLEDKESPKLEEKKEITAEEMAKYWDQLKAFLMANKLMLPTELSLSLERSSAFVGDMIQFEGILKSEGRPLAGREIVILINGSSLGVARTGENGIYQGSLRVPFWYVPQLNIQALYHPKDKDIGFYISSVSDVIKLQVMFYQAKLKLKIEGKTYPGLEKEINMEFDYGQSPLPAPRKVEIYLDNILLEEGMVDAAFIKKFSIRPDINLGKHTLTILAVAAGRYSPVIADSNINVGQALPLLDINIPGVALIPGKLDIEGKLTSELGPVKWATVSFGIGDSKVNLVTEEDGSFKGKMSMKMALNLVGSRNLRIQVTPRNPWIANLNTAKNVVMINLVNSTILILLIILFRKAYIPGGFRRKFLWGGHQRIKPVLAIAPVEPIPVYSISQLDTVRTRENQEPEGGPREIILYFYKLLLRVIQELAKIILSPHHTLREFAQGNSKILGPLSTYFLELTKMVEKLLYSKYIPSEADMRDFKQLSGNVEEGLKNRNV